MRAFVISDNTDTAMGFRLIGVDGVVVHSESDFREEVIKALDNENIALLMITEKLIDLCTEWIYQLKFYKHTQIVQIPDRHGSKKTAGDIIGEYLKSALGVSLQ